MTCKEKLIQDNPVCSEAKLNHRLTWDCPSWHDYAGDPVYCDNGATIENCVKCWEREYIEQTSTIGDIFKVYEETDDGCDEEHDPVEYYGKTKVRKSVDILKDHLKMLDIADERREYMTIAIECLEYLLEETV